MITRMRKSIKYISVGIFFLLAILVALSFFVERRFLNKTGKPNREAVLIEERSERVRADSDLLSKKARETLRKICDERSWELDKARVHAYKDVITVWHPSEYGSSGSVTVDTIDNRLISELEIKPPAKDGAEQYVVTFYNLDGTVFETSYKGGIPHGARKDFYPEGALQSELSFKEGKKDGLERVYSEDGKLIEETLWKNNKVIGNK